MRWLLPPPNLDFERAGRIKARIDTINSLTDRQHAVSARNLNADVIGIEREETIAGVHVFMIREGRIVNGNEFVLDRGRDVPDVDLLHNFLLRYYDATTSIPHEVIVDCELEDEAAMEQWLTEKLASPHGAKVRFTVPQRGEKAELLAMARKNAGHTLSRYKVRTNYEDKRINDALMQLESALALDTPPMRIECFDISTIHGSYTVASMVVFTGGRPDKNQYRRFKIKTPLDEANDFLSMREVLGRRYAPERMADERFGKKPDLLIVDGAQAPAHGCPRAARRARHHRYSRRRPREARRRAVCSLAGYRSGRLAERVELFIPREARSRRKPSLRDYVPSRTARQGYDEIHP